MKKKVSILLVLLMFIVSITSVSFADELSNKQKELDNAKGRIDNIKDKISDVKEEKQDVLSILKKLESQSLSIQNDINSLEGQIDNKQNDIKATAKELDKAIEDYNSQKEVYGERIRAMYMNGPTGYIEMLLSSESFSDFISKAEVVKKIVEYDKNLLKEMKGKQDVIQSKKDKLTTEKQQLVSIEKKTLSKKSQIDDVNSQKKSYYAKLEKNEKELQKALNEEERTSKQIEKDIQRILASMKDKGGEFSGQKTGILKVSDIGRMPRVTSRYGMRWHPTLHVYKLHTGMDLGVPQGTPVYAMSDGEVIIAKYLAGYGNTVAISHGGGITSLYAHNSKILVSEGQHVKKGQLISKSGNTGYSTGPHLHFEIRKNGTPINPEPYFIIGK